MQRLCLCAPRHVVVLLCGLVLPACRTTPSTVAPADPSPGPALPPEQVDPTLTRTHLQQQAARVRPLTARPRSCQIAVLHVQIPVRHADAAEPIWNHLRLDALDADTRYRLRLNGLRVGVGSVRRWQPVRLVLESIEGRRVVQSQPVRVPPGFPVRLELSNPIEQETIFVVAADGVVSGQTFTDARHVLRVEYRPDPAQPQRLIVRIIPEIDRDHQGWRWVRTESGLWQIPDREQTALLGAAFELRLAADEYVVIAPSSARPTDGLVGARFLHPHGPDGDYNSYVFIRPNVTSFDALVGTAHDDASPTH